jgi:molybdenum cofactor biosynthesis enzyme MoaA
VLAPHHVETRLAQILRRGSRNVGEQGTMARLMVMATRSCELRCAYCLISLTEDGYGEPHAGHPDEAWRELRPPRGDLALDTLLVAIDLMMTSAKPRLGLQYFGGEPTRRFDEIVASMRHAVGHPLRNGRPVELLLTTNGMGLTAERVATLRELGVTVQFSFDGGPRGNRFRRGHLVAQDEVGARVAESVRLLNASGIAWFVNATLAPAAAGEVLDCYRWVREQGIPALQMTYGTGMKWSDEAQGTYLDGVVRMLEADVADPGAFRLFNWQNHADPVPLCGDVILDVDGTVFQIGAIFHEHRFPALRPPYRRGHVREARTFDDLRIPLGELWAITERALAPADWEVFSNNVRLGAAVDLVVQLTAQRFGRRKAAG